MFGGGGRMRKGNGGTGGSPGTFLTVCITPCEGGKKKK